MISMEEESEEEDETVKSVKNIRVKSCIATDYNNSLQLDIEDYYQVVNNSWTRSKDRDDSMCSMHEDISRTIL